MKTIDDVVARPVVNATTSVAVQKNAVQNVRSPDLVAQEAQDTARNAEKPRLLSASAKTLAGAVETLNRLGKNNVPALEFEIDDDRDVVVIKVINRSTGEVIRELPPEAVVDSATRGDGALPALVEADA